MTTNNIQLEKIRTQQKRLHISMLAYLLLFIPLEYLDVSADIVVSAAPIILILRLVVAVYIGQLASAKNQNGVILALFAMLTPYIGLIVGYVAASTASIKDPN